MHEALSDISQDRLIDTTWNQDAARAKLILSEEEAKSDRRLSDACRLAEARLWAAGLVGGQLGKPPPTTPTCAARSRKNGYQPAGDSSGPHEDSLVDVSPAQWVYERSIATHDPATRRNKNVRFVANPAPWRIAPPPAGTAAPAPSQAAADSGAATQPPSEAAENLGTEASAPSQAEEDDNSHYESHRPCSDISWAEEEVDADELQDAQQSLADAEKDMLQAYHNLKEAKQKRVCLRLPARATFLRAPSLFWPTRNSQKTGKASTSKEGPRCTTSSAERASSTEMTVGKLFKSSSP